MNYKLLFLSALISLCFSCKQNPIHSPIKNPTTIIQKNDSIDLKNWHFKDIELDTIPGISLERAYDSILNSKKGKKTIVAIIDTEIDINHKELFNKIWINEMEIPNNGIDDDKNGYIDDINGWNYIGNPKGENNIYVNFETTRIIKKWKDYFQNKDTLSLDKKDSIIYSQFKTAQLKFNQLHAYYLFEKDNYVGLYDDYFTAKKIITGKTGSNDIDIKSLKKIQSDFDTEFKDACELIIELEELGIGDSYIIKQKELSIKFFETFVNINYNDREIQGDDPEDLSDIGYGNNKLAENIEILDHGTPMAGIITGVFNSDNVKIMPLATSCYGDEHDKDIALAIRYAVDNGAKVINMSFYKEMSMHKDWVLDAIKYADDNDVLIVSIAGNDGLDINLEEKYPNDRVDNDQEIADNFILAGASNYKLDKDFRVPYSNYGNRDVDLFAPGEYIYTTAPFNEYENDSNGTSSAGAITSGVAALIRSYYPDLTASQVKHILMDSGIEYTIPVATPTEDDPDKMTPFNELSKSGKVVNAYNALIMAERVSRGK